LNPSPITEPIIDLTDTKTFIVASIFGIIFGVMIAAGFTMIQDQIPNVSAVVKFQIFLVCTLTGSAIGFVPYIVRAMLGYYTSEDNEEDNEEGE